MLEEVQGLYDEIYQELKNYLLENSIYEPHVYKKEAENKLFPKVVFKELPRNSVYTTLKYTDELYTYGLEINIYAIQDGNLAGATIANELAKWVEKFFKDVYRMTVNVSKDVPNKDTSVYRNLIQVRCLIDTKYGDKLIILPIFS